MNHLYCRWLCVSTISHVFIFIFPLWLISLPPTFNPRRLSTGHPEERCGAGCGGGVRLCSANLKPLEDNQEKALAAPLGF